MQTTRPQELAEGTTLEALERLQYDRGDKGFSREFEAHYAALVNWPKSGKTQSVKRWQKDGRCLLLGLEPISEGGFLLHVQDTTTFEQSRRLLLDAQERVRLATEIAGIGIWVHNLSKNILEWDAQQASLYGYPPEEVLITNPQVWVNRLHPDDRATAIATFEQSAKC